MHSARNIASAATVLAVAILAVCGLATAPQAQLRPVNAAPSQVSPAAAAERTYLDNFGRAIEARFAGRSVGYAVVGTLPSGAFVTRAGGDARRTPDPYPRPMSVDDKITIASVSKTMTAAAIMKLLARNGLTVDTPVSGYLPSTWTLGPGIKSLTFRELLSHRSGIRCTEALNYLAIKACFAEGIDESLKAEYKYNNTNFAVFRIILPRLDGMAPAMVRGLEDRERRGDPMPIATALAAHYIAHMNANVFAPAGLPIMQCRNTDALPALSYKSANPAEPLNFSIVGPGESWGDRSLSCGSGGWVFSARQLAVFMHALTHTAKILPPETVAQMKAEQLGLHPRDHGGGLTSHSHGGFHPAERNKGELHTMIADYSNGLSVGLVVNSKFAGSIPAEVVRAVREADALKAGG